jgi:RNA polymerase sigma-70 factor (family 1)
MPNTQLDDTGLWAAICLNDESAFTILFDRYWVRLFKTAQLYLKDREASEELVHDVFLNIWNRRHILVIDSFPAFLLTAVRYQVYNRMRLAKVPVMLALDDMKVKEPLNNNTGEDHIIVQEFQQELAHHLVHLPKRCQEIFYMSRVDQLSNQEIADKLCISKRTVENQLTIALKHLRSCLKYACGILMVAQLFK